MNYSAEQKDTAVILSELSYILMKLCHGNKQEKKEAKSMLKELMPLIKQYVNDQSIHTAVERLDYTNEELVQIEQVAV